MFDIFRVRVKVFWPFAVFSIQDQPHFEECNSPIVSALGKSDYQQVPDDPIRVVHIPS